MKELKTAADFNRVQRSLLQRMRAAAVTEKISAPTLIREEMNALIAEGRIRSSPYSPTERLRLIQRMVQMVEAGQATDAEAASTEAIRPLFELDRHWEA